MKAILGDYRNYRQLYGGGAAEVVRAAREPDGGRGGSGARSAGRPR